MVSLQAETVNLDRALNNGAALSKPSMAGSLSQHRKVLQKWSIHC